MEISIIDLDAVADEWVSAWSDAELPREMPEDADLVVAGGRFESDRPVSTGASPETYWLSTRGGAGPWVLWAQAFGQEPLFGTSLRELAVAWTREGSDAPRETAVLLLRAFWSECRRAAESIDDDACVEDDLDPCVGDDGAVLPRIGLLSDDDAQSIADAVWS